MPSHQQLLQRYQATREFSERLAAPLAPEDCVIQSMPDVSPTRWHLAHTTWFFETFVLKKESDYNLFDSRFEYLFNSYYNAVGEPFPRARRGLISRPTVAEVLEYRRSVDREIQHRLESESFSDEAINVIALGLQHEQQHQELMLTDIKHVLSCNPLFPAYVDRPLGSGRRERQHFVEFDGGIHEIGHAGDVFAFDNESPRHRVHLEPFTLASNLVTAGDYLEFMNDGGYSRPELWLSLGWQTNKEQNWQAPLYWHRDGDRWLHFTLGGLHEVDSTLPICHVSYFEADAYARWAKARLPTEAEWEVVAEHIPITGNFAQDPQQLDHAIHPGSLNSHLSSLNSHLSSLNSSQPSTLNLFGDVWEWTASPYTPYPGYAPPDGALGEYNGKFMCNQFVLRGGSCATPPGHIRSTYRNFFPPEARWQFSGIRLAR